MNKMLLKIQPQINTRNTDKKVASLTGSHSEEDHLNTLADIIIERLLEVKNKNTEI
jgi:cell division protein ZapA (FtsZ GTPase activity inhibitor)